MKRIEVVIDEEGDCTIEAFGYAENDCLKATEELEKELGTCRRRRRKQEVPQPTPQQRRTVSHD